MEITEAAKTRLKKILPEKQQHFRVFLKGGGCAGFKYEFQLDGLQFDDTLFPISEDDDYGVIIDPMSYVYLEESELDFVKELMGESFVIHNPNTQTTCGCGSSVGF
jgi:iron-sulfur cluster insertion protein